MAFLLGDRERLAAMGERARRDAVRDYSLERMVTEYQAIYEAVARRGLQRERPSPIPHGTV